MSRRCWSWAARAAILALVFLPFVTAAPRPAAAAAPVPSATFNSAPYQGLLGQQLGISVTFDNTGDVPGYGPYIDLFLPKSGSDGTTAGGVNDGLTFASASYLGVAVPGQTIDCVAGGNVTHPLTGLSVACPAAPAVFTDTYRSQLVVLPLPFGSFTPSQTPADVVVTLNASSDADLGTALPLKLSSGFRYGALATGSTPILQPTPNSTTYTPTLFTLTKTNIAPEHETATGPNFPRRYEITASVAPGQTVANMIVTDTLPTTIVFLGNVSGGPVLVQPPVNALVTPAANTLAVDLGSVTGSKTVAFDVYVNRVDGQSGNPAVIDPAGGQPTVTNNTAAGTGSWTPTDLRDTTQPISVTASPNPDVLTNRSIAIQKGASQVGNVGAAGYTPGDVVEYTLNFQVSDYFAFTNVSVRDTLGDGLRFDVGYTPRLSYTENQSTSTTTMAGANYGVVDHFTGGSSPVAPIDGTQEITFRVSDELVTRGQDARLIGGCVPQSGTGGPPPSCSPYNAGGTIGTITFRAIVQDSYTDTYLVHPYLKQTDSLPNAVEIAGDNLQVSDASTPTGSRVIDTSGATIKVPNGTVEKSIYAYNGILGVPARISPSDRITYRLKRTFPIGDVRDLKIQDFLPLPVLKAAEVTAFNAAGSGIPAAGSAHYGPADTFHLLTGAPAPVLATDAANSLITFTYGTYTDPTNTPVTIDLLFTVTVSDDPFVDGLLLTNQQTVTQKNSPGSVIEDNAIVQILLGEPNVVIKKGIVATNNATAVFAPTTKGPVAFSAPGGACPRWSGTITSSGLASQPINSNLSNSIIGDRVSFAIVVENSGTSERGAFNVTIGDTIPAGFAAPAAGLNLCVRYGDGTAITTTGDLFGAGLVLTDLSATQGALNPYSASSGTNLIVITYDLEVQPNGQAAQQLVNTANVSRFSGSPTGANFLSTPRTDPATDTLAAPTMTKSVTGTSESFTTGSNVVIGEEVTYTVSIRIPEDVSPNATLVDTLPNGFTLQAISSLTASPSIATSSGGGFPAILSTAQSVSSGRNVSFAFGTLDNSDRDPATSETITIVYRALVTDHSANAKGAARTNSAVFKTGGYQTTKTASVTIVEPVLAITKNIVQTVAAANDTVQLTLRVTNSGTSPAHDITIEDPIPLSSFTNVTPVTTPAGYTPSVTPSGANTLLKYVGAGPIAVGESVEFTFSAKLAAGVTNGQVLTNTASVTDYSTLPGPSANERHKGPVDGSDTIRVITPDIVATKTDGRTEVYSGQLVEYTLTIRNAGERDADNVVVTDTLPAHVQFVSASNGGSYNNGNRQVTWTIPALAAGASTTRSMTGRIDTPFPATPRLITNTVTARDDGTHGADPTPANNTGTDVDTVLPEPDLHITKRDSGKEPLPGETITYTLRYTNTSTTLATNTVLTETVPEDTTYVAAGSSGWSCPNGAAAGTVCTLNAGTVNGGANGSATFIVKVDPGLSRWVSHVHNEVVIGDDGTHGADPTPANNRDSIVTFIAPLTKQDFTVPDLNSVLVNGGASLVTSRNVTLSFIAYDTESGLREIRCSNSKLPSGGVDWSAPESAWQPWHFTMPWTLAAGDGPKEVYCQVRDRFFKENPEFESIGRTSLYTGPGQPGQGQVGLSSIAINGGFWITNVPKVTLSLISAGGAGSIEMRFSNDENSWSDWKPFANSVEWKLSDGDGRKTVYGQLRDQNGTTPVVNASILLDTQAPSGGGTGGSGTGGSGASGPDTSAPGLSALAVNGSAASSTSDKVVLTLVAFDGQSGLGSMRFKNEGGSWSDWKPFATSLPWTLGGTTGRQTVIGQVKDKAGNVSAEVSASILLGGSSSPDTSPPGLSALAINGSASATKVPTVTLTLVAFDGESGLKSMRFKNEGGAWSAWLPYAPSASWVLPEPSGRKTVIGQVQDAAGNASQETSASILYDPTLASQVATQVQANVMVQLTLTASDENGVGRMRIGTSPTLDGADWQPYATIVSVDAAPTLYVQFEDHAGNLSAITSIPTSLGGTISGPTTIFVPAVTQGRGW